jgi:hypothetical protein
MSEMSVIGSMVQFLQNALPNVTVQAAWVNQNTKYPCITLTMVSQNTRYANEKPWLATPLIQVDSWSNLSMEEADFVSEALEQALRGYDNPVRIRRRMNLNEDGIYRTMTEYEVHNYLGVV